MTTRVMTAHVPSDLAEKVDALAEQMDRSRGWIIKQALAAWVEEEERHQGTLQALTSLDAGRSLPDEAVQAWIESLDSATPLPPPRA